MKRAAINNADVTLKVPSISDLITNFFLYDFYLNVKLSH